jgi:hypothetical protein
LKPQPRSLRLFLSRDCWGQRRLKPWYARAVTNGGPGAAALEYSDEGEEAKDPPPTAEGDSSEDEKPVPEDGGPNTRPSEKPVWRALGRWWKLKSRFLCYLSPTRQKVDSVHLTSLNLFARKGARRLGWCSKFFFRSPGARRERITHVGKV